MIRSILPIIAAALALCAPIVYIRAILRGEAKPHRTTRFVLMVITLLSASALFAHGDKVAIWLATASAIQGMAVFIMSIKRGVGGGSKIDILCLVIALIGIILWQVTKDPFVGLLFSILADFTGGVPMFIKTWHRPDTEIWQYYAFDVVGSTLILLSTTHWDASAIIYPVYIFFANVLMVTLVLLPHTRRRKAERELG